MEIYIADQMIDLSDERLHFRLADATPGSARIVAALTLDLGGGKTLSVGNHSEALANSEVGRARLAQYPAAVQGWLIPGIWGEVPTVSKADQEGVAP